MARADILVVGAGGHASACIDVIERGTEFTVAGLVGLPAEVGSTVLGYPVLGVDANLPALCARFGTALVSVGQVHSAKLRQSLFERLTGLGCLLPAIVSPLAYVSPHALLGAGSIVMHGAIINAGAEVGQNCIINSRALVEHDCHIADHCHVSTGAVLNGGVAVGVGSFIGSAAVVREGVRIGERCFVGMGLRVTHDWPAGTISTQQERT
jgi:sugar O-acyltransferase (sialic acid O-acetyltransferase NeuD family)